MTGPEGRPLRAGTSVKDIMGGMFGAIGMLAALRERDKTGAGQEIHSALFENWVFLSAQHIQQFQMTGEQLFIGAVNDKQWLTLCRVLDCPELAQEPGLQTNAQRVGVRPALPAKLGEILKHRQPDELSLKLEAAGIPYAPIVRPDQPGERPASAGQQ